MAKRSKYPPADFSVLTGDKTEDITVNGRDRWALEALIAAGPRGCTPVEKPAPRWSAYIFNLRGQGVDVETITETHGGTFPGSHGRYVLRSVVMPQANGASE